MQIKVDGKCKFNGPLMVAVQFAKDNGFEIRREPFGKRGSLIEIYKDGEMIGYRKSYAGAMNLMKNHKGV